MKCSNCGNEMVHSRNGWLCISCGHVEADTQGSMPSAQIATGKEGHDQMRSAGSDNESDVPVGTPATPVSNNPAPASDTPSQSTGTPPAQDATPAPPPATAPPWADPPATKADDADDATDTDANDEPKEGDAPGDDEAPALVDATTAPEPTGQASMESDASAPSPTPEDLSAVEKAVEQVEKAKGSEDDAEDKSASTSPSDDDDKPSSDTPSADDTAGATASADDDDSDDDEKDKKEDDETKPGPEPEDDKDENKDDEPEPASASAPDSDDEPKAADKPEDDDDKDDDDHKDAKKDDDKAPETDSAKPDEAEEPAAGDDEPTADDKPAGVTSPVASDIHVRVHPALSHSDDSGADKPDSGDKPSDDKPADDEKDTPDSEDDKPGEAPTEEIDAPSTDPESLEQVEHDEDADHKADTNPADAAPAPEPGMPQLDNSGDDPDVKDDDADDTGHTGAAPSSGSGPRPGPDAATTPGDPVPDVPPPIPDTPPDPAPSEPKAATELSGPPGSPDSSHLPQAPGQPAPTGPAVPQDPAQNAPAATPPDAKAPLTPQTHPGPIGPLQIAAIIVVIVAAALLAYFFFMQPKTALGGYLEKVASTSSTTYTATVAESASTYRLALNGYGQTNFTNRNSPQMSLGLSGQVSAQKAALTPNGEAASGPVTANALISGKTLYVEASTPAVLSQLAGITLTNSWYKYDLSGDKLGKCTAPENGPGSFFSSAVFNRIPVTAASFGGLKSFSGTTGLYYSGTIEDAGVQTAVAAINKSLSSACALSIPASALRGVNINFQLWRGWSKDQLQINVTNSVTGTTSQIVIDSTDYGKLATINLPAKSIDAQNLFHNVLGAEAVGPNVSPANLSAESRARDAQREVILANYLSWYKDNSPSGVFPLTPPPLTVQVNDPLTNNPYVVLTKPTSAVGQIWYHAGGSCTGPGITPGRTGTRYLSLVTTLESGQPYCVDTK